MVVPAVCFKCKTVERFRYNDADINIEIEHITKNVTNIIFARTKTMVDATKEIADEIEQPFISNLESYDNENETICQSLANCKFWKLAIYGMTVAFAFQFPDIVINQVGAKYFNQDDDNNNNSCSSGNAKYAYYGGIFDSIGGLLAFFLEGYIGRLSDVYGRKKIMYLTWFCMFISFSIMSITSNIWFSLILSPLMSLCGMMGGSPSVLQAAIADSVKSKKNRTVIFALLFGIAGFVVIIASILCPIVVKYFGIKSAFYVFTFIMIIALLWLIFVVDETLSLEKRKKNNTIKYENPFKIFLEIKDSKILTWFSIIVLVTAIPETGLNDMLTNYCNDQLDLCGDSDGNNETTSKDALFTMVLGISLLSTQLIGIPILTKCFKMSDIGLFIIGLLTLQIMMFCGGLLFFIPNIIVAMGIFASFGGSYLLSPIVDGSLSKRLSDQDQGIGIGVVHGVKGITSAFAPYLFAGLYNLFDNDHWFVITPSI